MYFTLICPDEATGKNLAEEMSQRPWQLNHLRLGFGLSSRKSESHEAIIHAADIVSGALFTRIRRVFPLADSVLLTAADTQQLLSEAVANVIAENFDIDEVPLQSSLYGILEQLLCLGRETLSQGSGPIWDAVYWDDDHDRPDQVCTTINELCLKFNKVVAFNSNGTIRGQQPESENREETDEIIDMINKYRNQVQ